MKKLLLIGSASIHVLNYYHLIRDYFDDVCIISNEAVYGDIPTHLVDFALRNPIVIPSNIRKIKQVIESFQPTVIHIHQANSVAWLALKAAAGSSIPTVLTAWGDDVLVHPNQNKLLRRMVVSNLSEATVLTSDSLYMAGEMQKLVNLPLDIVIAVVRAVANGHHQIEPRLARPLHDLVHLGHVVSRRIARGGIVQTEDLRIQMHGVEAEVPHVRDLVSRRGGSPFGRSIGASQVLTVVPHERRAGGIQARTTAWNCHLAFGLVAEKKTANEGQELNSEVPAHLLESENTSGAN